MPEIDLAKKCNLTLDDGTKVSLKAGKQDVPDHVAEHWFVKAHCVGAKPSPAAGTPAFLKHEAQERARLEAEHIRLEAERERLVTASVREKMEADLGERMQEALAAQAKAAVKDKNSEIEKAVAAAKAEFESSIDQRLKEAAEAAVAAHIAGAEDDKPAGKAKGGK